MVKMFPLLLDYVHNSDDMFLLLHGTAVIKMYISVSYKEINKIVPSKKIIAVATKLLQPALAE